jgi:hypothetical protein
MVEGESRVASHSASTCLLRAERLHQDLDPRLPQVVAPAVAVVDAQDRLEVGEHVAPRQEFTDHVADHRRAAHAAAHRDAHADFAVGVADQPEADVVQEERGAIRGRAVHRDLEFARQPVEFGMGGRPLAQDLGERASIDDLVGRDPGEMVGRDVAHAVTARLDRVHVDLGELGKDLRDVLEPRPVELQVLARAEVPVAAVVAARDVRELAQLRRGEHAVGNGHAQHRRMALDVQPVAQPQRPELILGELTR